MIAVKRSLSFILMLLLAACVTVNIYFPAAAAEKAADQLIEDIWQERGTPSSKTDKDSTMVPTTRVNVIENILFAIGGQVAYAQEVNFSVSSPDISQIKAKMSARFKELKLHFQSGAIGLTEDGYVAIHNAGAAAIAERGKLTALIKAENSDRKALYAAIAQANGQPAWQAQIQQAFAKRWISQAPAGWWYQSGGKWKQK